MTVTQNEIKQLHSAHMVKYKYVHHTILMYTYYTCMSFHANDIINYYSIKLVIISVFFLLNIQRGFFILNFNLDFHSHPPIKIKYIYEWASELITNFSRWSDNSWEFLKPSDLQSPFIWAKQNNTLAANTFIINRQHQNDKRSICSNSNKRHES